MERMARALILLGTIAGCSSTEHKPEMVSQASANSNGMPTSARGTWRKADPVAAAEDSAGPATKQCLRGNCPAGTIARANAPDWVTPVDLRTMAQTPSTDANDVPQDPPIELVSRLPADDVTTDAAAGSDSTNTAPPAGPRVIGAEDPATTAGSGKATTSKELPAASSTSSPAAAPAAAPEQQATPQEPKDKPAALATTRPLSPDRQENQGSVVPGAVTTVPETATTPPAQAVQGQPAPAVAAQPVTGSSAVVSQEKPGDPSQRAKDAAETTAPGTSAALPDVLAGLPPPAALERPPVQFLGSLETAAAEPTAVATVKPATGKDRTPVSSGTATKGSSVVQARLVTAETVDSPAVHMVNSRRINLNYEVKDVGWTGIADVELWFTQDGQTWRKYNGPPQHSPPYVVEVEQEDLYGFTLVGHSGAGLGKQPPQPGDLPQVWVEVDVTKPIVRLLGIQAGSGAHSGTLSILWTATDKNLEADPITLSYARQPGGPWVAIASRIKNSGRYTWQMPTDMPKSFFVRVEAVDRVGNVGAAQTPSPLLGDVSEPSIAIVTVTPAPK